MKHDPVRRGLIWGLAATLLLPLVLVVTLGTAALLAAVGDDAAAAVCRWIALPLGVLWAAAIAATTALSATAHLAHLAHLARPGRRRGRRRLRRDRPQRHPRGEP
jgi:hypothetical protein